MIYLVPLIPPAILVVVLITANWRTERKLNQINSSRTKTTITYGNQSMTIGE